LSTRTITAMFSVKYAITGYSYPPVTRILSGNAIRLSTFLHANYPNPLNIETRIEYALPEEGHVRLAIYNVIGQQVRLLVDEVQAEGFRSVRWNGRDEFGREVGTGVYFIQLLVEQHSIVRKLSLQK